MLGDEVLGLLSIFLIDLVLSSLSLFFDLLGVLLFKKFSTALKTFLQHSVEFLLLTFLVTIDETGKSINVLLMIFKEAFLFFG